MQVFVSRDLKAGKKISQVSKAKIKISLAIIFYTLMGVMGLTSTIYYLVNVRDRVMEKILCESSGSLQCDDVDQGHYGTLSVVTDVMIALTPVVALLFSTNLKVCRKSRN